MMIIGVNGKAHAGKDAVADVLVEQFCFTRIALADEMKRTAQRWLGFSDEQMWGNAKETPDVRYRRMDGEPLTPRHFLQQLGSEFGRAMYPDLWIDIAIDSATRIDGSVIARYRRDLGVVYDGVRQHATAGVVIPDIRFRNEMDAIRKAGGTLWRVKRGSGLAGEAGAHISETEQDGIPDSFFDVVIDNTGTLEELAGFVDGAMRMMRAA